jgi:methyl-accepting chemotaxis protein
MLGLVGVAVVVGVFPIIRRLLKRLENLQRGVKRFGEGDLSVRVPEHGMTRWRIWRTSSTPLPRASRP